MRFVGLQKYKSNRNVVYSSKYTVCGRRNTAGRY